MVYTPAVKKGTTRKLRALWDGPYEAISVSNNGINCTITRLDKKGRKVDSGALEIIHVARLKKYYSPASSVIRAAAAADNIPAG
jgi:hypothetical protein